MPVTPSAFPGLDTRYTAPAPRPSRPEPVQPPTRRSAWLGAGIVLSAYVLLLALTRTLDQGDSHIYGDDLISWFRGLPSPSRWDFGHALWRPINYALFRVLHGGDAGLTDGALFSKAVRMLTAVVMLSGALAVVTFRSWLERLGVAPRACIAASLAFMAAAAFVGYAQTASSYIPALAMLLVALRELAADDAQHDTRTILIVSFAFALAVLLWFPMVLGVPAAAISMLILRGDSPRRRRVAIAVCVLSGAITVLGYVPIAYVAGVRSLADFRFWMAEATHDIVGIGGISRAIVGLGRSLVNMDRLGLVTKRHLIGDSYNPASWGDVARAGLLRLAVLYALLGAMALWLLLRSKGRRALGFLVATAIPVVGFALKWQGGDLERYLALFPALFLAVAAAIALLPARAQLATSALVVVLSAAVNVPAIARAKTERVCEQLTTRLASVPRTDGKAVVLWTPHELDEIATFRARCPYSPLIAEPNAPQAFGLVMANNLHAPEWRDSLADRSAKLWARGGHVWIARRAFVARPLAEWKWAEGDDPKLHWADFPAYFSAMDVGPPVGGEDGFVEVLPTSKTRDAMARLGGSAAGDADGAHTSAGVGTR